MIDINKEAEKYAKRFQDEEDFGYNGESISIEDRIEMEAFIAGHNSKATQAKVIQGQIDVLKEVYQNLFTADKKFWLSQQDEFDIKIHLLQQKLNELKNE